MCNFGTMYPMLCHLNGVHISEVSKFLAESPSVTTHAIQLTDTIETAHLPILPLQLSRVISYFEQYMRMKNSKDSPHYRRISISINEWLVRKKDLNAWSWLDQYLCFSSKGPVQVSTVISYSLAFDVADIMDSDNLMTALSAQIQISIAHI